MTTPITPEQIAERLQEIRETWVDEKYEDESIDFAFLLDLVKQQEKEIAHLREGMAKIDLCDCLCAGMQNQKRRHYSFCHRYVVKQYLAPLQPPQA